MIEKCPECGKQAEKHGVMDHRDSGGEKFRMWVHNRNDSDQIDDWCAEIINDD